MSTLALAINQDSRLEGFALAADGALWHAWQKQLGSTEWNDWTALGGGPATQLVAGRQQAGALTVFALVAGQVQMIAQTPGTATGWGEWTALGGPGVTQLAVASNSDGRLEVFGTGASDGNLWHVFQETPNGSWSLWRNLAGAAVTREPLTRIAVIPSSSGDLVAFGLTATGQVQLIEQDFNATTGWGSWLLLDGSDFKALQVGRNQDGRLEIFTIGGELRSLWHTFQKKDDDEWSPWEELGNQSIHSFAVASNADGRLEVMALAGTQLQHIYQVEPNSTWSVWDALGAPSTGLLTQIAVTAQAVDGILTAFTLGAGITLARIYQQENPKTDWSPWCSMGALPGPPVDHVVVLMLENRSFDSVLGYLYTQGSPPAAIIPPGGPGFQGLDGANVAPQQATLGKKVFSRAPEPGLYGANSPGEDPGEEFEHVNMQLFGQRQAPPAGTVPTMSGFLQDYCDVRGGSEEQCAQIMRMATPADLPILNGLAATYAVSDAWFSSVPTQTDANRAFSLCGTSLGSVNNAFLAENWYAKWIIKVDYFPALTIWNALETFGVPWRVYTVEDYPPRSGYSYTWLSFPYAHLSPVEDHFQRMDQFLADAQNGTLPAFTYLEPKWAGEALGLYIDGNDYHPPVDVTHSELALRRIYEALRGNEAAWQRTLLVIMFDEHGGTYDHVPPPGGATPPWGPQARPQLPKGRELGFNFDRFGVRVPFILASPWIDAGTVFRSNTSVPFDHTSMIASVLDWQGIDRSSVLGGRVAAAPSFWHALTRSAPRTDDRAFPPIHGPAAGTTLMYGQPFRLKHQASSRYVAAADLSFPLWYPTLGGTPIVLEMRRGYGPVRHEGIVQLRTSELKLADPAIADRPCNTLGAWRGKHDLYYWHTDVNEDWGQQLFKLVKPGAQPGDAILFGDAISIQSDFPAFRGEAVTPSGDFLTTARGATDLWIIEPMPEEGDAVGDGAELPRALFSRPAR